MHKGIDRIPMFDSGFRMVVPAIHSPKKCSGPKLPVEVGYPWERVFKGQLTNSGFSKRSEFPERNGFTSAFQAFPK